MNQIAILRQKMKSPISAAEMPQASSSPNTEPPQPQESVDHANVENSGSHGMSKLMKNMKVCFKRINEDNWITGTLVSRAGKVTGKYPNAWNAKTEEGIIIPVDFDRDISTWEETEYLAMEIREPDEVVVNDILQLQVDEETTEAKERELGSWVDKGVFEEVADNRQHCMTTRWVIKPK